MLWIHIQAPFAAFRPLQAGSYRTTYPVIPPSAAWGLVLNLAGIDVRKGERPTLRVAIGQLAPGEISSLYQHLHHYLVGATGKELAAKCHGSKYWISPGRREILSRLDCVIGVDTDPTIEEKIRAGICGELQDRYGVPFAGDGNFMFSELRILPDPPSAHWWCPVTSVGGANSTHSLPIKTDFKDSSKTIFGLFSPTKLDLPPPETWIEVG